MKNRKLLLIVSLVLAMTMSLGGTLAYLSDTDADVNTMVLGNVKITQNEHQRAKNADGTYKTATIDEVTSYVLEVYENDKPLLPTTELDANGQPYNYGAGDWDKTTVRMTQIGSYGGMQVFESENAADKFVTVTNTGKTDAYVRTFVAVEAGKTDGSLIGTSYHTTWAKNPIGVCEIKGNNYYVVEYVYAGAEGVRHENGILPAGDTTYPSLSQVYLKAEADNDDMVDLDGNENGKLDILVLSQAIQANGFDPVMEGEEVVKTAAQVALEAGFGEANKANVQAWFEGWEDWSAETGEIGTPGNDWPNNDVPSDEWTVVSTADELVEALENNEDVLFKNDIKINPANMSNAYGTTGINVKNGQTIDGNGNTLDIKGAGGTWDSGINTTGGLIKNITVTGSFRGIFINHNSTHSEPVVLENVTIEGTTYTISCDQGLNQNLEAYDSTFNGWTSFAATLGNAKFVDCEFGYGNGYKFCRPYAPTEFVGCNFCEGYTVDPRAAVTFENCTINGVALTADNLATLVTDSNISNATVK